MTKDIYSITVGSHLVVMINGYIRRHIAEVVSNAPLRLKVEEEGPLAHLKDGDYIILTSESCRIQDEEEAQKLLREATKSGYPLISGLKSLGVVDGKCREITPTAI